MSTDDQDLSFVTHPQFRAHNVPRALATATVGQKRSYLLHSHFFAVMTPNIKSLYQRIGIEAAAHARPEQSIVLLYAEVEENVVAASVFATVPQSGVAAFRFASNELTEAIYALWTDWQNLPQNTAWKAMAYVLDGSRFMIDLVYAKEFDNAAERLDRRAQAVTKHLGIVEVDYTSP